MIRAKHTVEGTALRRRLGLSVPAIILLAANDGSPPRLGGNLQGALAPGLEAVVFRTSAF